MTRLVLDASSALEAVLGRSGAGRIADLLEAADKVTVPDLFFGEVANALWKYQQAGEISNDEAQELLDLAGSLVDEVLRSEELVTEALASATAYRHPVYDALYAVTARRAGAAVLTLDKRLVRLLDAMRVPVA